MVALLGGDPLGYYGNLIGYGNQDISGSDGTFWLTGNHRITQEEQAEFMQRLYINQLPLSIKIQKRIFLEIQRAFSYSLKEKLGLESALIWISTQKQSREW